MDNAPVGAAWPGRRIVVFGAKFLLDMVRTGTLHPATPGDQFVVADGLPVDARILGVSYSAKGQAVAFLVESAEWPPLVDEGVPTLGIAVRPVDRPRIVRPS